MKVTSCPAGRLARIAQVSQIIAAICSVFVVILPLGLALYVFEFSALLVRRSQVVEMGLTNADFSGLAQLTAFFALLIGSLPMLWALIILRRRFLGYAQGDVFTSTAAARLKMVAMALLAMVVFRPLTGVLLSLALSIDLPNGERQLVLSFSSNELWVGLAGLMVLVTAWVMGESAALAVDNVTLAEENPSFV